MANFDNESNSIFLPNYTIPVVASANGQVIVGDIIDIFDARAIQFVNMYYTLVSGVGTDLNVTGVLLEQADDLAFTSPETIPAQNIIGDINDLTVNLTDLNVFLTAQVGAVYTKRFVRQTILFDRVGGLAPSIWSYTREVTLVRPKVQPQEL